MCRPAPKTVQYAGTSPSGATHDLSGQRRYLVSQASRSGGSRRASPPGRMRQSQPRSLRTLPAGLAQPPRTRRAVARLFGISDEARVIFTLNATHALNIALKGLLGSEAAARGRSGRPGHVVTSSLEHNAVARPLATAGRPRSRGHQGAVQQRRQLPIPGTYWPPCVPTPPSWHSRTRPTCWGRSCP